VKVVVLRRETHLPPVANRGPMPSMIPFVPGHPEGADPLRAASAMPHQSAPAKADGAAIIAQIAQSLAGRPDAAPIADAKAVTPPPAPSAPAASMAVKMVEIQLHPAALGTITVSMRLSAAGLKVSMTASVRETAQMLQEQRSELVDLIRRAGYGSSDVTVEQAAAVGSDADGDAGQPSSGDGREHRDRPRQPFPDQPDAPAWDGTTPRSLMI
jgi:chemotaxis protein MotD